MLFATFLPMKQLLLLLSRKSHYRLLAVILISMAVGMNSCIDDELDDPFSDPVEKFLGSWKCSEKSTLYGSFNYNMTISRNPQNSTEILISHFYNHQSNVRATALVTGSTLTIPRQNITSSIEVQGNGSYNLSQGTVSLNYTARTQADQDNVAVVLTRP